MPAKPEWLLRLPEIRAELDYLAVPIVDRAGIERIFGLKRRRAIELLHQFGGYQAGRTFLLDRARLLEALQSLESGEDYTAEKRRRERLGDVVEASREHLISTRVRIPVRAAAARASLDPVGARSPPDARHAFDRVPASNRVVGEALRARAGH
jgi:hypothetical protein